MRKTASHVTGCFLGSRELACSDCAWGGCGGKNTYWAQVFHSLAFCNHLSLLLLFVWLFSPRAGPHETFLCLHLASLPAKMLCHNPSLGASVLLSDLLLNCCLLCLPQVWRDLEVVSGNIWILTAGYKSCFWTVVGCFNLSAVAYVSG